MMVNIHESTVYQFQSIYFDVSVVADWWWVLRRTEIWQPAPPDMSIAATLLVAEDEAAVAVPTAISIVVEVLISILTWWHSVGIEVEFEFGCGPAEEWRRVVRKREAVTLWPIDVQIHRRCFLLMKLQQIAYDRKGAQIPMLIPVTQTWKAINLDTLGIASHTYDKQRTMICKPRNATLRKATWW